MKIAIDLKSVAIFISLKTVTLFPVEISGNLIFKHMFFIT